MVLLVGEWCRTIYWIYLSLSVWVDLVQGLVHAIKLPWVHVSHNLFLFRETLCYRHLLPGAFKTVPAHLVWCLWALRGRKGTMSHLRHKSNFLGLIKYHVTSCYKSYASCQNDDIPNLLRFILNLLKLRPNSHKYQCQFILSLILHLMELCFRKVTYPAQRENRRTEVWKSGLCFFFFINEGTKLYK